MKHQRRESAMRWSRTRKCACGCGSQQTNTTVYDPNLRRTYEEVVLEGPQPVRPAGLPMSGAARR